MPRTGRVSRRLERRLAGARWLYAVALECGVVMVGELRRLVFSGDGSPDDENRLDFIEVAGLARPSDVLVA